MRERVLLFGGSPPSSRPEGLERALVRAGFSLADAGAAAPAPLLPEVLPDLALVVVDDELAGLERALAAFQAEPWTAVPVIALLPATERNGVARALSLGAADAMAAPVNLVELVARLESRLRMKAELSRVAGIGPLQSGLFRAIEELSLACRPGEMLETLTGHVGALLEAAHCACLALSEDRRYVRLLAVHGNPTLRNMAVDLFLYPEAAEAAISGRTVYAPEVLRDRIFLTHLAQWPDSPEVHEIESAVAVPLLTGKVTRAVLVIRTRRGEPPITPDRVALVEQLVNAAGSLLEREERLGGAGNGDRHAAGIDPLTRCASAGALDLRLREELERARRYGTRLAFARLKVATLGDLHTRYGEAAGDRLLSELAGILRGELRGPDFVARSGADEFALLLPSTDSDGADAVLARLLTRVAHHRFAQLPPHERPALATGLVVFPDDGVSRVEDVLAVVDAALASHVRTLGRGTSSAA